MIDNELLGPGVHVKWDGVTMSRFLKLVAWRVWIDDIPRTWRSIIEPEISEA